jgi:hypothetical protein
VSTTVGEAVSVSSSATSVGVGELAACPQLVSNKVSAITLRSSFFFIASFLPIFVDDTRFVSVCDTVVLFI